MKKNFILLTGIVFLIAVLAAVGCSNSTKQQESSEEATPKALIAAPADTTTVMIYLKDREIDGIMHLEMSDSKKPECPVIDNLETLVHAGDTVIFKKAQNSKVRKVTEVRVEYNVEKIPIEDFDFKGDSGLYVLIIDTIAPEDTIIVKYDIVFTVKQDTFIIDPYLKIPKEI